MSGVCGVVHFRGEPPESEQVARLSASLAHRGPDERAAFVGGPAALSVQSFVLAGERRRGPDLLETDDIVALIDGSLFEKGAGTFDELWRRRGPAALDELDGAFALVVWERKEQVLWLARDGVGTRPLHWARSGGRFAFSSEIPPLLDLPWVSRTLATDHLAEYLSFRYLHAPRTLLRDVSSVPSGHLVRVDASGERTERWWRPRWSAPDAPTPDTRETLDRIDQALGRAVERRCPRGSPVAVLLSGGLDSSAILAHAAALNPHPLAFTVALADDPADESSFAGRVSTMLGAEHHLLRLEHKAVVDGLLDCTAAMGAPLPSAASVLQHLLFKAVTPHSRVILSGDGGDEVLGGRGLDTMAERIRRARMLGHAPSAMRGAVASVVRRLGRHDLAASPAHFGRDRSIGGSRVFHSAERVDLLRDPGLVRPGIRHTVLDPLYEEVHSDPINDILHVWQRGWLPEDSLARSDRMGAHAGADIRYPLLDRAFLQLLAGLPSVMKVHPRGLGFVTKWPLRELLGRRLPEQLVNRPKRSLPNPLSQWLRGGGAEFLREQIEAVCEEDAELFVPGTVRRLMTEHLSGAQDHGLKLWTLLLFRTWRQSSGA